MRTSSRDSAITHYRRDQIITAAAEVIATDGIAEATFARIAQQAGLSSPGMVSYHFTNRDDLLASVWARTFQRLGEHVGERVRAAGTPTERFRHYLSASMDWMLEHETEMRAAGTILLAGGAPTALDDAEAGTADPVERLLRDGQETGEFRADLDVPAVAALAQRSLEGLSFLRLGRPHVDPRAYAATVLDSFDRLVLADRS